MSKLPCAAEVAPLFHARDVAPELRVPRRIAAAELSKHDVEAAASVVVLAVASRLRRVRAPVPLRPPRNLLAVEAVKASEASEASEARDGRGSSSAGGRP